MIGNSFFEYLFKHHPLTCAPNQLLTREQFDYGRPKVADSERIYHAIDHGITVQGEDGELRKRKLNFGDYGLSARAIVECYKAYDNGQELLDSISKHRPDVVDRLSDYSREGLVEELEDLCVAIVCEHRRAEKRWYQENNIQPKLAVGLVIHVGSVQAHIVGISDYRPAFYEVQYQGGDFALLGSRSKHLIQFETLEHFVENG